MNLGQFQDAFVDALYGRPAPELAALTGQAAFSVYRNTVLAGCVDALCDNFPSVERLVGRPWLRSAALAYAEQSPPCDARLIHYGAAFPAYLESLESSHGLVYLADVARLDFAWNEAFSAPREPSLQLTGLAGMTASDLARSHLAPCSSVRWYWFAQHPVFSLWRCSREGLDWSAQTPWQAEGVLLSGHAGGVHCLALEAGGCAFLDACAAGHTLEVASGMASSVQPDLDFTDLLGRLIQAQALRPLTFD